MKKLLFFIILLISLFIINNLVRSIYSLWQKQDLVLQSQKELTQEKAKYTALQGQLRVVDQPSFIEQEARNKLFLVKPGEQLVLVPNAQKASPHDSSRKKVPHKANWQQWVNLFF